MELAHGAAAIEDPTAAAVARQTQKQKKGARPLQPDPVPKTRAWVDDDDDDDDDDTSDSEAEKSVQPVTEKAVISRAVHGFVEACVGPENFLITIRVKGTDLVYRGVVFGPGAAAAAESDENAAEDDPYLSSSPPSLPPQDSQHQIPSLCVDPRLSSAPSPFLRFTPSSAFKPLASPPIATFSVPEPPTDGLSDPVAPYNYRPTAFGTPTTYDQEILRFMYQGGLREPPSTSYNNGTAGFFAPPPPPRPDNSGSTG